VERLHQDATGKSAHGGDGEHKKESKHSGH
jgi:hypothetical protein